VVINIKKIWTGIIEKVHKSKTKGSKQEFLTESESVEKEIQIVLGKLERSWSNFLYANDDYINIAIMEIYCDEMEYGILYNKLKQLYGHRKRIRSTNINSRDYLPWLNKITQNILNN